MKWIILAWWSGTRLFPITKAISKQLMPIYDKPMIYYPLTTLLQTWIKDILVITTPQDNESFKRLLWNGSNWWINIEYAIQPSPDGLAQAFIIGEKFIWNDNVCLVLGDNLFYGSNLDKLLLNAKNTVEKENKGVVFGYKVSDPERYGVVEFDESMNAISIEEKPKIPKSSYAVVWLYFYPNDVIKKAKKVKPSKRWELEITDVNNMFLEENRLKVEIMDKWYAWLDTGTHNSMMQASNFIQILQERQGIMIGSPEEICYKNWYIKKEQLKKIAKEMEKTNYGKYLLNLIK